MPILYIVSTPIGNLEDLSFRALRVLSEVDLILAEDTRVTKKLIDHYQIKTPVLSYHQHSKIKKLNYIVNLLKEDKNLAMVSDAGTPGISDPGGELVEKAVESLGNLVKIVPIPGSSALTAAASVSGFKMDKFLFLGFPPVKKKRKKFFEEVINSKYPVIFYESPYRIVKTLEELRIRNKELRIVVGRELTKKFETVYRGAIERVIEEIKNPPAQVGGKVKGEFVVIVSE